MVSLSVIVHFSLKAKGMLQEIMIEHKKLETKMRHNEEEYEVTREEIAREVKLTHLMNSHQICILYICT